ncbi:MAG: signal peptidase II [Gemmatimonadetes bacterium]|nr:signal peptidase II [Gemmatimonadota bacterium]
MKNGASAHRVFWPLAIAWVTLDYLTKRLAERELVPVPPVEVIGDWLRLRLVYNPGAAFGLHLGPYSRWIFLVIATAAVIGIAWRARQPDWGEWLRQIAAALVVGGAAGNLIDRIRGSQGVVDFIDVGIGVTRYPTFNVADIGVSCGAVALAISFWLEDTRRARESKTAKA